LIFAQIFCKLITFRGQQFAQQMSEDHPEVVERLRQQMGSSDNQNQPKTE